MKRKRKNMRIRWLLAIFIIAVLAVYIYQSETVQKKFRYPFPYRVSVEKYARLNKVDPLLIVSIMKAESSFDCRAVSQAGAMGLMQLMPDSADWIASQAGTTLESPNELLEPDKSIELGSWYIASLLDERHGNLVLALAAYNAGRGVVDSWMQENGWKPDFAGVDKIPYKETRNFVKRVTDNYNMYKKLYRSD